MSDYIMQALEIIVRRTEAIIGLAAVVVSLITQVAVSIALFI